MLANNNVAFPKIPFGALLLIAMGGFFLFLRINKCCGLCKRGFLENIINFCHTGFLENGLFLFYRGILGY